MAKVKIISRSRGVPVFNMNASELGADWLKARRLLKEGKIEEMRQLDKMPMFTEPLDEEEFIDSLNARIDRKLSRINHLRRRKEYYFRRRTFRERQLRKESE